MQEYELLKAEIDALAQEAGVHLSPRSPPLSFRATTRDPWIADQVRNDNLGRNDSVERTVSPAPAKP